MSPQTSRSAVAVADESRERNWTTRGIFRQVAQVVAAINRDPRSRRRLTEFHNTILVLSATDTGRELAIVLDGRKITAGPYEGKGFDVRIRATERVHRAVLFGEMDADAAFFTGRVRISGSILTAFCVKNTFLSLVQEILGRG